MSSLTMTHAPKGLEGVVATTSKICYIDGENGVLAYGGIDIHELAEKSTFEETCYLLWHGRLPNANELKEVREKLAAERQLDPAIIQFIRELPKDAIPMDALRTAVSVWGATRTLGWPPTVEEARALTAFAPSAPDTSFA